MAEQKKPNWADESDEEWSDNEVQPVVESKPQTVIPDPRKDILINQLKKSSFPLVLSLGNLSFQAREPALLKEFGLSNESSIEIIKENNKNSGFANVNLANLEDALLVAEKNFSEVLGRRLFVKFPNESSYNNDRGKRGARRNTRRGGRQTYYEERGQYERKFEKTEEKPYEKHYESRNKPSDSKPVRITIAPGNTVSSNDSKPQTNKPKSNPFGDAKPIDTLNKDLEFEKVLEEKKKQEEVPDEKKFEDKVYKIKQIRSENKEGLDSEKNKETVIEKDLETENKHDSYYESHNENRGRGRRAERYRKKYSDDRHYDNFNENDRNYHETGRYNEGRRRFNHGRFNYSGDKYNHESEKQIDYKNNEKTADKTIEKPDEITTKLSPSIENHPKTENPSENQSNPVQNYENPTKPENLKPETSEKLENPEKPENLEKTETKPFETQGRANYSKPYRKNHQEKPYENRQRGYNKKNYDDERNERGYNKSYYNEERTDRTYNKRNSEPKIYENKKLEEEKANEEKKETRYVKKNDPKEAPKDTFKEIPKTKAWVDPELAAQIIKKPKEPSVVKQEEKVTKLGNPYVKKKYQES